MLRKHLGRLSTKLPLFSSRRGCEQLTKVLTLKPLSTSTWNTVTDTAGLQNQSKVKTKNTSDIIMFFHKCPEVGNVSKVRGLCVCECVVSRTQCTKVRRTPTSNRFQLHMPTVTTNSALKCCFKLSVYLFYLLKKTWHTYTQYLDKHKAPNPRSCFWVQFTEGLGRARSGAQCFYEGQDPSLHRPVRGQSQWNPAVPSSAALSASYTAKITSPSSARSTECFIIAPINPASNHAKIKISQRRHHVK